MGAGSWEMVVVERRDGEKRKGKKGVGKPG
jgi:hypothetical protein